jgi:hypothetical protein
MCCAGCWCNVLGRLGGRKWVVDTGWCFWVTVWLPLRVGGVWVWAPIFLKKVSKKKNLPPPPKRVQRRWVRTVTKWYEPYPPPPSHTVTHSTQCVSRRKTAATGGTSARTQRHAEHCSSTNTRRWRVAGVALPGHPCTKKPTVAMDGGFPCQQSVWLWPRGPRNQPFGVTA